MLGDKRAAGALSSFTPHLDTWRTAAGRALSSADQDEVLERRMSRKQSLVLFDVACGLPEKHSDAECSQ